MVYLYVPKHQSVKQLERKLEYFLNEVCIARTQHPYPFDLIIDMDETPKYFNMVPEHTISKIGLKEVRIRSSGAEKRTYSGS